MFVFSLSLHHKAVFEELRKLCEALVTERRNSGYPAEAQMEFPGKQSHIHLKQPVDVSHTCHFCDVRIRGQGSGIFFQMVTSLFSGGRVPEQYTYKKQTGSSWRGDRD